MMKNRAREQSRRADELAICCSHFAINSMQLELQGFAERRKKRIMAALWRALWQEEDVEFATPAPKMKRKLSEVDIETPEPPATRVPQPLSARLSLREKQSWVERVQCIFRPIFQKQQQVAPIRIITTCSGTGCPTLALKDSMTVSDLLLQTRGLNRPPKKIMSVSGVVDALAMSSL